MHVKMAPDMKNTHMQKDIYSDTDNNLKRKYMYKPDRRSGGHTHHGHSDSAGSQLRSTWSASVSGRSRGHRVHCDPIGNVGELHRH